MTSLPLFHVNAPTYSVLGSIAARASVALLPRFSASGFIDAARRHGATEFNAIGAMLEILMRQPERPDDADNPLRLCYTGPVPRPSSASSRSSSASACASCAATRMSETPLRADLARAARGRSARSAPSRQHPTLGDVNEARVMRDGQPVGDRRGRRAAAAQPGGDEGLLGACPRRRAACSCRTAGCAPATWSEDNGDGTLTFVGREKEVIRRRGENVAPAEIEEVLMSHPDVRRGGGRRRALRAVRGGDQGLRACARRGAATWPRFASMAARAAHALQGAALPGGGRRAAAHPDRPGGQAPAAAERTDDEVDFEAARHERRATGCAPASAPRTPTRSPSWAATWRAS